MYASRSAMKCLKYSMEQTEKNQLLFPCTAPGSEAEPEVDMINRSAELQVLFSPSWNAPRLVK